MSTNVKENPALGSPREAEAGNGTSPAKTTDLTELTEQIKKLVEKLEAPKRKTIWGRIACPDQLLRYCCFGGDKSLRDPVVSTSGGAANSFNPDANSPDGIGLHFHRDYDIRRNCPGSSMTKEMVVGWLKQ